MESEREAAERVIKPIFAQFKQPYRMLQEIGHPVEGIIQVADSEQAELVIIGSRGLTGLKEMVLGSVSHGLLHHAHTPILIIGRLGTYPADPIVFGCICKRKTCSDLCICTGA